MPRKTVVVAGEHPRHVVLREAFERRGARTLVGCGDRDLVELAARRQPDAVVVAPSSVDARAGVLATLHRACPSARLVVWPCADGSSASGGDGGDDGRRTVDRVVAGALDEARYSCAVASTFLDGAASSKLARRFTRTSCQRWRCRGEGEEAIQVAGALVDRAINERSTRPKLTLRRWSGVIRVEVTIDDGDLVELASIVPLAVLSLRCSSWGVRRDVQGWTTWGEVACEA